MTPHLTPIYMFSETRKQTTEESVGPAATRVWQGGGVVQRVPAQDALTRMTPQVDPAWGQLWEALGRIKTET